MTQPAYTTGSMASFGSDVDLFGQMGQWGNPMGTATGGYSAPGEQMTPYQQGILENQRLMIDAQQPSALQTGAQTFGSVANGLANLGQIWMGLKGMKAQKEAFRFNKGVTNTNLNNSITDYNRRLGDTLANRALNTGQSSGWVSEQLAKYQATRSG